MRTFGHSVLAVFIVCTLLATGPGALWHLGAEGTWLSWLPTDALVVGIHNDFWRHMALGFANGVALVAMTLASAVVWQKWDSGAQNSPQN